VAVIDKQQHVLRQHSGSTDATQAHTHVDVIVNQEEVRALLADAVHHCSCETNTEYPNIYRENLIKLQAHTNVDVIVNLEEVRTLLADRLPHVFAGASVADAALPWPAP